MPGKNRDVEWDVGLCTIDNAKLAVLMDIRDQLKQSNRHLAALEHLANCYRIPRALDAMIELGAEARRKKRAAAKKRKAARDRR